MKPSLQLNYPRLALPAVAEELAFDAIEQILSTDPVLAAATETFLSWTGDTRDLWEPAVDTCPFLRISPGGSPSNWESEGQHRMPMTVTIEAAVVGSDRRQIQRYWGAIRTALFPPRLVGDSVRSDYIRTLTQQAGIARPILTAPAYGCIEIGEAKGGARITLATGTLELILLINTP